MGWNDNTRKALAHMISKAKRHLHVTEVIRCPIRIPIEFENRKTKNHAR